MNDDFQRLCDRFVANKNVLSKSSFADHGLMDLSGALLLTDKGVTATKERIKECEKVLKEGTSLLSDCRGNVKIPLMCKMLCSGIPAEHLRCVLKAYKMLKKKKWSGNEYKILAAMVIYDHAGESEYQKYVDLSSEIYCRMKKNHRWITSNEDIPFSAILATSGISPDKLIDEMEACYTKQFRRKFHDNNAVQALSQVLALCDKAPEEKCQRVLDLFDALKQAKHQFGTGYELATLGTFTMIDYPIEEIVTLIGQADDYLKSQRGFGNFSLSPKTRRMYAAQLCLSYLSPKTGKGTDFAMGSTLALYISVQASAYLAASTACIAATASH